jgi:hypothetical protein
MNVRLPLIALLACTSLACNLSDPNAPLGERPVQGQSCSEVGDTFGNLECDGETWQSNNVTSVEDMETPTQDMGMTATDMMTTPPVDMSTPTQDMCAPQSDEDLCALAAATCGELQTTDACGEARTVPSCGDCAADESCVANSCTCDAVMCDQVSCGVTSNACGNEVTCGCDAENICDAGTCTPYLTLTPPDPALTHNSFGFALALRGNYLAVGAPGYDMDMTKSRSRGAVFLYRRDPITLEWTLASTLEPPNACNNCRFGAALDFDDNQNMLVVGEPGDSKVHIYTVNTQTNTLELDITLESPDPFDFTPDKFGFSVSSSDPYLAVGAPDSRGMFSLVQEVGAVYLFRRQGQDWNEVQLPENYHVRSEHMHLGWSIDLSDDRLLIGSPGSQNPNQKGRAYLLERNGQDWALANNGTFNPQESNRGDLFGNAVALGALELFVGMADANLTGPSDDGAVFRYHGDTLEEELFDNTFHMPQENDSWGYAIATRGDVLVVGIPGVDVPLDPTPTRGPRSGAVIYQKGMDGQWVGVRLFVPMNAAEVHAGTSLAISEDFIAVGASGRQDDALQDRVFVLTSP